jgi:hypothetical protein
LNGRNRQGVLGQRAGLVGAQDNHRCCFIDGGEASRKNAPLCESPRAQRQRKGKGGPQRDGYRCQDRGQDKGYDVSDRHLDVPGVGYQQHDDYAVESGEIAHDT